MSLFKKNEMKVPNHLAIILDGNGRWALKNGLVRSLGHKAGAKTLVDIISYAFELGVKVLSLYCFSTENWKRDKNEVDYLLSLPIKYFEKYGDNLLKKDIKVIFSGNLSDLPNNTIISCDKIKNKTGNCKSHILNFCLNYGSHDEIISAVKKISSEVKNGLISIEKINEKLFESYLYSKNLPSIDFLIRTSDEKRLSNFMLWQMSYAEIYFCRKLWPEFTKNDLRKAFIDFNKRNRRFGGVI